MNRQEYISYRNMNQFPPVMFYEYYMENVEDKNKVFNNSQEFLKAFAMFMPHSPYFGFNVEKVLNYFDTKFNVLKIGQNDKIVKYS